MAGESDVSTNIMDELHSWYIKVDQMEGENGLLEVSSMNFTLGISKEIKWKEKMVLLEV